MKCHMLALCAALTLASCSPPASDPEPQEPATPQAAGAAGTPGEADAKLSDELKQAIAAVAAGETFESEDLDWQAESGTVLVVIEMMEGADPKPLAEAIGPAGGQVEALAADRIAARLPLAAVATLAADPDVKLIRAPIYPNRQPAEN